MLSPTGTPKRQTGIREQSALTADSAKNIFTIYDLLSNSELLYTWQKVIIKFPRRRNEHMDTGNGKVTLSLKTATLNLFLSNFQLKG